MALALYLLLLELMEYEERAVGGGAPNEARDHRLLHRRGGLRRHDLSQPLRSCLSSYILRPLDGGEAGRRWANLQLRTSWRHCRRR